MNKLLEKAVFLKEELSRKMGVKTQDTKQQEKSCIDLENATKKGEGSSRTLRFKQYGTLLSILILIAIVIGILIKLKIPGNTGSREKITGIEDEKSVKIELASEAVKSKEKYPIYVDNRLDEESKIREQSVNDAIGVMEIKHQKIEQEQTVRYESLKGELDNMMYLLNTLNIQNQELANKLIALEKTPVEEVEMIPELNVMKTSDQREQTIHNSWNYIPATSYVSGELLGGISVSTSVSTITEPIPVIIRLTRSGNLPKDFAVSVKECRILGSCYGDLSSRRAMVRGEELVCEDKASGSVISTKIAGVVFGDDGKNGIRGEVISADDELLTKAFAAGILSGASSVAKGQGGVNVSPTGVASIPSRGVQDMVSDSLFSGVSTATEKLADHYIKLADKVSPVIEIPGGTKVDIVFTKGVIVGSGDIKEKIEKQRGY